MSNDINEMSRKIIFSKKYTTEKFDCDAYKDEQKRKNELKKKFEEELEKREEL